MLTAKLTRKLKRATRALIDRDPAKLANALVAAPVAGHVAAPLAGPPRYYCASHLDAVELAPGEKITRYRPKENPCPSPEPATS